MRHLLLSLLVALILPNVAGCDELDKVIERLRNTVGRLNDSEAFVAVVADDDQFLAYVCDGGDVAVWFDGPVADGAFSKSAAGVTIEGTIGPDEISGTVTFPDGQIFPYTTADVVSEFAGLWEAVTASSTGGWIVDDEGNQRGAFVDHTTDGVTPAPPLEFPAGTVMTEEGTVSGVRITEPGMN